jgi:hypothetical protein
LLTLIGYLPIGIQDLVRTAVGPRPRRLPALAILMVLLTALTIIPVTQALVELIVRPVTIGELVDRRVGLSTQLVAVDGLALLVPFDADPPRDAGSASTSLIYHWYAVRDSLQERRLVLVRSLVAPESLRLRRVIARVVDDADAVDRTVAGIEARGGDPGGAVAHVLLTEIKPRDNAVRDLGSLAELDQVSAGEIVRLTLRFGDGIATCVGRGDCQARTLADGIGSWDNLATDADGSRVVVRTGYPPSVAPFHGVGHHAQDREAVGRFLALPVVQGLLGWGHVLQAAYVEHDLSLPIDHLWWGPILFTLVVALLLLGLRLSYPRFRPGPTTGRSTAGEPARVATIPCRATGRITPPGASPFEIDDLPATLRREPTGDTSLRVEMDGGPREFVIPENLGGLGATELGDLLTVRAARPALKVGWFGSNVLLAFVDRASRDAATSMFRAAA